MSKHIVGSRALACLVLPGPLTAFAQFSPTISVLTNVWIDGDPGFWTVKPAVVVKPGAAIRK